MKHVIQNLKQQRKRTPLLIKDLCKLMGHKGHARLSRIEGGKQTPNWEVVLVYHLALGIPLRTLFKHEITKLAFTLQERIDQYVPSLLEEARIPEVHERIEYLTSLYDDLKNKTAR